MGSRTMISYQVKPEAAARNKELVQRVYQELAQTGPEGFHYATFVQDDGVSFIHIVSNRDDDRNPILEIAAFREFQDNMGERLQAPPDRVNLTEVGSYRFWGK